MHVFKEPLLDSEKSSSSHFSSGVQTVVADLHQDGDVDQDLRHPTHPELGGAFINHKVRRLENVTSSPQEHHLYAEKEKKKKTKLQQLNQKEHKVIKHVKVKTRANNLQK